MKRKQVLIGVILVGLIVVVSCNTEAPSVLPTPISVLTTPASPTVTATLPTVIEPIPTKTVMLLPTETPTSLPTTIPTITPCPVPISGSLTESIIFSAVECADRSCEPFDGDVAPIYLINSDGSNIQQIYTGIGVIGDLQLSPDNTQLAFTDNYGRGISNVYVLDFVSGHAWFLVPDDTSEKVWGPRWVSNDKLVFIKIDGMNSSAFQSNLYLANVDGTQLQQLTDRPPRTRVYNVSVSPDGRQLLFVEFLLDSNVTTAYRMNIDGTELTELITFPEVNRVDVSWSPTGDQVFFYPVSMATSQYTPVYTARADGSGIKEVVIFSGSHSLDFLGWTEDQAEMIFYVCNRTLHTNQLVKVQRSGDTYILATIEMPGTLANTSSCLFGVLSPDQRLFALSPFYPFAGNGNLYVVEISTGCCHQILSGYRIQSILWHPTNVIFQSKR